MTKYMSCLMFNLCLSVIWFITCFGSDFKDGITMVFNYELYNWTTSPYEQVLHTCNTEVYCCKCSSEFSGYKEA